MIINSYVFQIATDVTPNSLNGTYKADTNIGFINGQTSVNAVFQINGINTTITLKLNYANYNSNGFKMYCKVANSSTDVNTLADQLDSPGLIADDQTFTVSNGQYVTLGCWADDAVSDSVYVYNVSDSNTLLTTVNAEVVND